MKRGKTVIESFYRYSEKQMKFGPPVQEVLLELHITNAQGYEMYKLYTFHG